LQSRAGAPLTLFKLSDDGKQANRVEVFLGHTSNDRVQIAQGLQPGDHIVVSDMSAWSRYAHLQLK
jgi:multidrug efflux pump subunit AcrA (membrane-fusion protein)